MAFASRLLSTWLVGFILAAAVAAMMSTVDSQLLVATSSVTGDLYKLRKPDTPQKRLVMLARISTVVIALVAFVLGLRAERLVYWLVLYAWGGLAASFGPPLILSLLWKRTTKTGAFVGMDVGAVVIVIWYNVPALKKFLYELVPGFLLSLLATWIASLLTQKKDSPAVAG